MTSVTTPVEVSEGEVVLDAIHRVRPPGGRPRGAVELQGRQMRLLLGRGQRQAATDVHDTAVGLRHRRGHHGHADAILPRDPRPRHRRLLQLREGQGAPLAFAPPPRDDDGKRRMAQIDVERGQEFRKCIKYSSARTSATSSATTTTTRRRSRDPRFFLRYADSTCTRWTPTTGASWPRAPRASGCATSPSAAPRSARGHQDHRQRDHPDEGERRRPASTTRWCGSAARSEFATRTTTDARG